MRRFFYVPLLVAMALGAAQSVGLTQSPAAPLILDMVHHIPGGKRYQTEFEDPKFTAGLGCNGKVYFLFDSPTLAVNWESVDPTIFPKGSPGRAWVDATAARIDAQEAACKAAGLKVYAMSDLILLPKALIQKNHLGKTFGDPGNPETQKYLKLLVAQVFERFPNLDGLVVRIGETYLQDAPYHQGNIQDKTDAQKTIIPLINLLREEICVKRNKQLIFRTWMSFDSDLQTYLAVSDAVEPHPNLIFSVKHCEGDFHRGNDFSKVIGAGRHPQIIEVECSREYEGKGAYPNYIANGVIDGFEEDAANPKKTKFTSIGAFSRESPLYAGIWTWSRGGGWDGPYIKNELWPDLNAWVMDQWAGNTAQSEEYYFNRYATEKLGLQGEDIKKFRQLCLLSAEAVLRGKHGVKQGISPWWSRDDGINTPSLPGDASGRARVMEDQADAVARWQQIVRLADEIQFPDAATGDYVRVSSRYGLDLYRIYQAFVDLNAVGLKGDPEKIRGLLSDYDAAWADYRKLAADHPNCASLYEEKAARFGGAGGVDEVVKEFRGTLAANTN